MASQVLYRKWRPKKLTEVMGQEPITQTLLTALEQDRVAHAYLFTGPRGTGKTSTARILAKAINCLGTDGRGEPDNSCSVCEEINQGSFLDLVEIDGASNRGIDDIKGLREKAGFAPARARRKTYIIDEVHQLTKPAFNALLKTLEEPPGNVVFILATTEPQDIPLTIMSRCQRFDFRRISLDAMTNQLARIGDAEGFQFSAETLHVVARAASGSLRDAENLLEQLVLAVGSSATVQETQAFFGLAGSGRGQKVIQGLLHNDMVEAIQSLNQLDQEGVDLSQLHKEIVEELRICLLIKAGVPEVVDLQDHEIAERNAMLTGTDIASLRILLEKFASLVLPSGSPPLPLEMAIVSACLERSKIGTSNAVPDEVPVPNKAQNEISLPKEEPRVPVAPAETESHGTPKLVKGDATETGDREPPSDDAMADEPVATIAARQFSAADDVKEELNVQGEPIDPGDIESLRARWNEVVNSLKGFGSNKNLDAILRSSSMPMEIKGDALVIGFYYKYHKEKVEDPKYRYIVERRITEFMGTHYKVECVLVEKPSSSGHAVRAAVERGARVEQAPGNSAVESREPNNE
jgi:DNA polymerase-3 subunit gamma/tau